LRIAAYGTVDETNAAIGMARIHIDEAYANVDAILGRAQNDLFDVGPISPSPSERAAGARERLRVSDAQVKRLEDEIDGLNAELAPSAVIRAAGRVLPARLRCMWPVPVCRRAEALDGRSWPRCRMSPWRAGPEIHEPPVGPAVRSPADTSMIAAPTMCFGCLARTDSARFISQRI
jgi:hypothetical protein